MKRIVLKYGVLSGLVFVVFMAVLMPLGRNGTISLDTGEILGYSTMVLAFLIVYAGIRAYREQVGGGAITFGKAFQVGILITLISCAFYVASWEVTYFGFMPDFGEKYGQHLIAKMRAKGVPEAEIAAKRKEMEEFEVQYRNPLYNIGLTTLEVLPLGIIMTLVSAAILRRRANPPLEPAMGSR